MQHFLFFKDFITESIPFVAGDTEWGLTGTEYNYNILIVSRVANAVIEVKLLIF